MMRSRSTGDAIAFAALAALAVVTPLAAHAIGSPCWIWLPAHWPVLLAGLALGLRAGAAIGVLAAAVELLWGGRGFTATLPVALELVTYATVAGALGDLARKFTARIVALVGAMLAGRLVFLAAALVLGRDASRTCEGLFVAPWPGIVVQLALLPLVATAIRRAARRSSGSPTPRRR